MPGMEVVLVLGGGAAMVATGIADQQNTAQANSQGSGNSATNAPPGGTASLNLHWPLPSRRYGSGFGTRSDPFTGVQASHGGVDIGCPDGTPIECAEDGIVQRAQFHAEAGWYIVIKHEKNGQKFATGYLHIRPRQYDTTYTGARTSDGDFLVKKGDRVNRGQVLARSGNTGRSTTPHLHFELWLGAYWSGTRADPVPHCPDCPNGQGASKPTVTQLDKDSIYKPDDTETSTLSAMMPLGFGTDLLKKA